MVGGGGKSVVGALWCTIWRAVGCRGWFVDAISRATREKHATASKEGRKCDLRGASDTTGPSEVREFCDA
jgi:hypothetical protein